MMGGTASARQDGRCHQPSRRASAPSIRCGAGAIRAAFARRRGVGLGKGAIRGMTPDDEIRPGALALEHFDVDGGGLARRLGSGFGWRDSSICVHWGLRHFERSRPSRPALSACHALVLRWGVSRPSFAPFPCVHVLGGQFVIRPGKGRNDRSLSRSSADHPADRGFESSIRSRSAIRPGPVGRQPSFSCVATPEAGMSWPINRLSAPK